MKFLIGFRKLTVTLICVALLTGFLISGHVDGVSYAKAISGMVIAFSTANVGEHLLKLGKEFIKK